MLKTPCLGPVIATMLLAGATACLAAPVSGGGAASRGQANGSAAGLNAWDGRLESAGITGVGEGDRTGAGGVHLGAGRVPRNFSARSDARETGEAIRRSGAQSGRLRRVHDGLSAARLLPLDSDFDCLANLGHGRLDGCLHLADLDAGQASKLKLRAIRSALAPQRAVAPGSPSEGKSR